MSNSLQPEAVPDAEMGRGLPQGVINSRIAAIRDERVETAKTITALEKVAVDAQNQIIRMRSILLEVTKGWPSMSKYAAIQEALETSE